MGYLIKRFVHRHLNVFNFLTASIIICICLIVLLPAAHLPLDASSPTAHGHDEHSHSQNDHNDDQNQHHHHHHHHGIPTGEVLVCAGFFVFHSIGLLVGGRKMDEREPLLIAERKASTVCCSSTRCPSSREPIPEMLMRAGCSTGSGVAANSHEQILDGAHMIYSTGAEDDCVLLLNQHHQHHTHNTHHEHVPTTPTISAHPRAGQSNYGSMAPDLVRNALNAHTDLIDGERHSRIYVEEIKAGPARDDILRWPLSIQVGLFAILFAVALVLFDLKIYGLMDALQVFRSASVGALLYIAFFLVLPKNSAGCGSCSKERA